MYSVVIGENWCSAVPQLWINSDRKTCLWPPNNTNITKAVKKLLQPDTSWKSTAVKYILGPYESYETARKIEKDAEFLSSDDAQVINREDSASTKRQRKAKVIYSSDEDSEPERRKKPKTRKIIPEPPSLNIIDKESEKHGTSTYDYQALSEKENSVSEFDILQNTAFDTQSLDYGDFFSRKPSENPLQEKENEGHAEVSPETLGRKKLLPTITHVDYNPGCNIQKIKGYKQIFPQVVVTETGLQTENDANESTSKGDTCKCGKYLLSAHRKLDLIVAILHDQNPTPSDLCNLLPEFPIHCLQEFKNLCKELEKSDVRKQFEKKVRTIGGVSAIKHLSNVLVITLTNHFAKHITWDGQRQTEGIKNTTFANVIIGTILNSHETSFNELSKKFSEWLRRAGDRYRYHIKLGSET